MKPLFFAILLLSAPLWAQESFTLTVLHINDTHAKHEAVVRTNRDTQAVTTNGGAAQLAGLIAQERALNPHTLVLDGGDTLTGSAYTLIYKGLESSQIMNLTGFSAAVPGNHEFDFGLKGAKAVLKARKFPTLAANVFETDTGKALLPPYFLTNMAGKTIALVGVLVKDEVYTQRLGSKGFITVADEIESLKKLFAEDSALNSADIFILLSHSGFEVDKRIAAAFPNKFALIVGGHSHTLLPQPHRSGKTLIVQLDNNQRRLGRIDLTFKGEERSSQYKQIPLINTASSPAVERYVRGKKKGVDAKMGGRIGVLEGPDLDDALIRQGSTPLGNFIADTLLNIYKDNGIDFVLINSGSVRSPLDAGTISLKTFFEIHPFDNTAYVVSLKGSVIKEILQFSAAHNWDEGGFLQLSKGLEVRTDKGRAIQSISFQGVPLDPDKSYRVLVSDWLFGGGDGYQMIAPNAADTLYLGSDFRDMLIEHVKRKKIIKESDIDPSARWVFAR